MDQLRDGIDPESMKKAAGEKPFVPPLELTEGQAAPVAANGGLSYMSFDDNGDAGTAVATEDALRQIASGEGQKILDMLKTAPPGPIETKWGLGFRSYSECMEHIREAGIKKIRYTNPEGDWECMKVD